jgi:hypothetical protein
MWVLLVLAITINGSGKQASVAAQEFDTLKACMEAGQWFQQRSRDAPTAVQYSCMPKGATPPHKDG